MLKSEIILTFVLSMRIIDFNEQTELLEPCVATIGFFDGVHQGHRFLIDKVINTARQYGMASTAITFAVHPRQVLCPDWHPQLLSTFGEKTALLKQTGIDQLIVLPFDTAIASLSARDFMTNVLQQQLHVRVLMIGYDNHFGHRATGSTEGFDNYVRYGRELGITVLSCSPFDSDAVRISSSQIRQFLCEGNIEMATRCLGYPYQLTGKVIRGEHIGTGLGFPTANLLRSCDDKLIPAPGVYAVRVCIGDSTKWLPGMMNIGLRPTFNGNHLTLETHIFHFNDNLYDQRISVSFVHRLRSEMKFDNSKALATQLAIDAQQAEELLNINNDI